MKKVGVPKPKKILMITTEMKEKIRAGIEHFENETVRRIIYEAPGSFMACGYLKQPDSHLIRNVNPIWLYAMVMNHDGSDVEETICVYVTEFEAKAFGEMLIQLIKTDASVEETKQALKFGKNIIIKDEAILKDKK